MQNQVKKIVSLILSIIIVFSSFIYVGAVNTSAGNTTESITMTEYDPTTGKTEEKVYEIDSSIIKAMTSDCSIDTKASMVNNSSANLLSLDSEFADIGLTKVSNTTIKPYSPIGLYKITSFAGTFAGYGTAFMISDNVALTCAHNLYNKEKNKWYSGGYFYPGKHGFGVTNDPFGATYAEKWAVCTQYIENQDEKLNHNYDWGAIVLAEDIGKKCGTLNISPLSSDEIRSSTVMTAGYPQSDTSILTNYNQYKQNNTAQIIMNDFFTSSSFCKKGQSGSPAIVNNFVCGILCGRPKDSSIQSTTYTRISESAYSLIMQYVSENA